MLEWTDQHDCDSSVTLRLFVSSETLDVQLHQLKVGLVAAKRHQVTHT